MGVAAGPDGNVWFTESKTDVVGRVTPGGTITEFHTPTPHSQPMGIVVGADRNLWFVELSGNNIGRVTAAGTITEFPIPTANSQPWGRMALGADGAVWFTERNANRIGRVTTAGQVTEFALDPASGPDAALPAGIVSAGDGNLWFLETNVGKLGRITPAGVVTTFDTGGSMPMAIGVDAAGGVWVGELNTSTGDSRIVRVDRAGHSTVVASGTRYANFVDLATGPDGAMWFSAGNTNEIGRIRPDGSVSELSAPSPGFLADGPGGALWFASGTGNAIGRVTVG
jgi:virginiamycin B lyase